jgi:hypothetical protein
VKQKKPLLVTKEEYSRPARFFIVLLASNMNSVVRVLRVKILLGVVV